MTSYLIETSIIWAVSLLAFIMFFRKERLFSVNRYFLIMTLIAGLVLPSLQFLSLSVMPSDAPLAKSVISSHNMIQTISLQQVTGQSTVTTMDSKTQLLPYLAISLYLLVAVIFFAKFIYGFYLIRRIQKVSDKGFYQNTKVYYHALQTSPFSFLNSIYLNKTQFAPEELPIILSHEIAHITKCHSIDVLILEITKVILWFHPFIYLYKKLIKLNHEYQADHMATEQKTSATVISYCRQLINPVMHDQPLLSNNFFDKNLKNRIAMLSSAPFTKIKTYKYLILLPIFILCLMIWSCQPKVNTNAYAVGAIVEKVISDNYFDSFALGNAYAELMVSHSEHKEYIQGRLKEHFAKMGGKIAFDSEAKSIVEGWSGPLDENETVYYYMDTFKYENERLPLLQPIKNNDLQETVHPESKLNPITKKYKKHRGVDYVAAEGSDVLAAGEGRIASISSFLGGFGKTITINHGSDIESFYAHLSDIVVEKGDYVKKGTLIGKVGSSGAATAPHLHFELRREGEDWTYEAVTQTVE